MLREYIEQARVISVIGLCKNAGKTTVLNQLIGELDDVVLGLTSVGRDGEDTDLVTGTGKPAIHVRAGTLFATAKGMLPLCPVTVEVLAVTDVMTPLGSVGLFRALSDGAVQLAGPSSVAQLEPLSQLFCSFGAEKVLIDGAAGRKSLASAGGCAILCTGASLDGAMESVVAETQHVCSLFAASTVPNPDARRIEGGITTESLRKLTQRGEAGPIAVPNATHILADRASTELFYRSGGSFILEKNLPIAAVCANSFSAYGRHFEPEAFLTALRQALTVPVVDVRTEKAGADQ
ncbi:MAG: hypothetical protein RSC08_05480 [Oscillospiraceae bacterium]